MNKDYFRESELDYLTDAIDALVFAQLEEKKLKYVRTQKVEIGYIHGDIKKLRGMFFWTSNAQKIEAFLKKQEEKTKDLAQVKITNAIRNRKNPAEYLRQLIVDQVEKGRKFQALAMMEQIKNNEYYKDSKEPRTLIGRMAKRFFASGRHGRDYGSLVVGGAAVASMGALAYLRYRDGAKDLMSGEFMTSGLFGAGAGHSLLNELGNSISTDALHSATPKASLANLMGSASHLAELAPASGNMYSSSTLTATNLTDGASFYNVDKIGELGTQANGHLNSMVRASSELTGGMGMDNMMMMSPSGGGGHQAASTAYNPFAPDAQNPVAGGGGGGGGSGSSSGSSSGDVTTGGSGNANNNSGSSSSGSGSGSSGGMADNGNGGSSDNGGATGGSNTGGSNTGDTNTGGSGSGNANSGSNTSGGGPIAGTNPNNPNNGSNNGSANNGGATGGTGGTNTGNANSGSNTSGGGLVAGNNNNNNSGSSGTNNSSTSSGNANSGSSSASAVVASNNSNNSNNSSNNGSGSTSGSTGNVSGSGGGNANSGSNSTNAVVAGTSSSGSASGSGTANASGNTAGTSVAAAIATPASTQNLGHSSPTGSMMQSVQSQNIQTMSAEAKASAIAAAAPLLTQASGAGGLASATPAISNSASAAVNANAAGSSALSPNSPIANGTTATTAQPTTPAAAVTTTVAASAPASAAPTTPNTGTTIVAAAVTPAPTTTTPAPATPVTAPTTTLPATTPDGKPVETGTKPSPVPTDLVSNKPKGEGQGPEVPKVDGGKGSNVVELKQPTDKLGGQAEGQKVAMEQPTNNNLRTGGTPDAEAPRDVKVADVETKAERQVERQADRAEAPAPAAAPAAAPTPVLRVADASPSDLGGLSAPAPNLTTQAPSPDIAIT